MADFTEGFLFGLNPQLAASLQRQEQEKQLLAAAQQLQPLVQSRPFEADLFPGEEPISGLRTEGLLPEDPQSTLISQLLQSQAPSVAKTGIEQLINAVNQRSSARRLAEAVTGGGTLQDIFTRAAQLPEQFPAASSALVRLATAAPTSPFTDVKVDDRGVVTGFNASTNQREVVPTAPDAGIFKFPPPQASPQFSAELGGFVEPPTQQSGPQLQRIPGVKGRIQIEQEALQKAEKGREKTKQRRGSIVLRELDRSLDILNTNILPATGFGSGLAEGIRGTSASNLKASLDVIGGQTAFQELQTMRNESSTGGALGQVAIREIDLLMSSLGSLSQEQGESQLRDQLVNIKQLYESVLGKVERIRKGETELPSEDLEDFSQMSDEELRRIANGQ